jgi:flagellar biosynthetic protein FliR
MESLPIIAAFYEQIDIFMLVLVRVIAFFIFLPIVSGMNIPVLARMTVALMVGAAIFSSGLVTVAVYTPTIPGFVMAALMEFMTGATIGYVIYVVFAIILFAGRMMDNVIGLAMVNTMNPLLQIQVSVLGNIFYMAIMAMLLVTGGLINFMEAFTHSFIVLPIGSAFILGNESIALFMVLQMVAFVVLAVQIALPILGALTILNIALGIMVKAAPQMNVFVIGMPIKILGGFILVMFTMVQPLHGIYRRLFSEAIYSLTEMIWRMSPNYV